MKGIMKFAFVVVFCMTMVAAAVTIIPKDEVPQVSPPLCGNEWSIGNEIPYTIGTLIQVCVVINNATKVLMYTNVDRFSLLRLNNSIVYVLSSFLFVSLSTHWE